MPSVAEFLEKLNRTHTREEELQKTKLPPLPAAPKKLPKPTSADVAVGKGKGEQKTLSDAIAAVKSGGIIHVTPGIHPSGKPIDTKKPFTIVGEGAARSAILFQAPGDDSFLTLVGPGVWHFDGVALLAESAKKGACCDILDVGTRAEVEMTRSVIAGAMAVITKDGTKGGLGVRANAGGKAKLVDCLIAFNRWNVAAHDGKSSLALERCQLFGAEFGVFVGDSALVTLSGGEVRRNRFGLKAYGEGASIVARDVKIVDQTMNGVYVEKGRIKLEGCKILDNGTHGVGSEEGTEVVAKQCVVDDNWESGLFIIGDCLLEANEIKDNADHGILLAEGSTGRVEKNECADNGGFGIVWDEKSKVERRGNRCHDNSREEEYELGTLVRELKAGLPKGVSLPESIAKLARYQEENGRLAGETMYVAAGLLAGWPGLENEFAVFGSGPDGSTIAFWLRNKCAIEKAPIVYLDSEGVENHVIAESEKDFLAIFATGPEELHHGDDIENERDEDDEAELQRFVEWLDETFGVKPAKSIDQIHKRAQKAHPGLEARLDSVRGE